IMIWDVHTHLYGVDGRTAEERMTALVRFADRMGVERMCVYMGYPFLTDPSAAELREQNDYCLRGIAHFHDRAFGFVYVSGNHPDASVREIDRCVKDGPMVEVKPGVARRCFEEELDPIITRATWLSAAVLQHL